MAQGNETKEILIVHLQTSILFLLLILLILEAKLTLKKEVLVKIAKMEMEYKIGTLYMCSFEHSHYLQYYDNYNY